MPDNKSDVSAQLLEINGVLVRDLMDRVIEILDNINISIENQSKIDIKMMEELLQIRDRVSKSESPFHEEDRKPVISFLKRSSSAISQWTKEEENAVIDIIEDAPGKILFLKKKLRKLYWIATAALVTTTFAQIGAPEWIQKLAKLIFG